MRIAFDPGAVVTREEAVNALMRARGLDRAENIGGSYVKSDDLFAESYVEEEGGVNADNAYVRSIFTDIPRGLRIWEKPGNGGETGLHLRISG